MSKKRKWYRETEAILYNRKSFSIRVHALEEMIKASQNDVIPSSKSLVSSYQIHEGKNYGIYSPVEDDAIRDLENIYRMKQEIKQLNTLIEITSHSIDVMMDEDEKVIIDLTYNKRKSWQFICSDLGIQGLEKDVYYRKRKQIIHKMAWCLGLLPDDEADMLLGISTTNICVDKS